MYVVRTRIAAAFDSYRKKKNNVRDVKTNNKFENETYHHYILSIFMKHVTYR